MKHAKTNILLAVALVGIYGSTVYATELVPNVLTSSVDIVPVFFGGTLLNSVSTNISNISFNGIARAAVYETNSGLDFYYQFTNNVSSINGIERVSAFDFSSLGASPISVFQTGIGFGFFSNGTEPSDYADRTLSGVIGFNFVPNGASKIQPGTTSFIQIIRTNGTSYTSGNFGLLDGIADNAAAFAPVTAVPEPSTYAMLGIGLLGIIAMSRRRQKANLIFTG